MFQFKELDYFTDEEIDLILEEIKDADDEKSYVPAYVYKITPHNSSEGIGRIDIRIGNNENTYYGGNIGYEIDYKFRGHAYAKKACKLVKEVAVAHGMDKLYITCDPFNFASRRTCENLGLMLIDIVDLPSYNDMYKIGERQKCIFQWILK